MILNLHDRSAQSDGAAPPPLSPKLEQAIHLLARRRMLGLAALFVTGHRPLAFVAGQMILLMQPVTGLLGVDTWDRWADEWTKVLSRPDGPGQIATALAHALDVREESPWP